MPEDFFVQKTAQIKKLPRVSRVERLWVRWRFLVDEQSVECIPTRTQNEDWDEFDERNRDTDRKSDDDNNLENAHGHEYLPHHSRLKKKLMKDLCFHHVNQHACRSDERTMQQKQVRVEQYPKYIYSSALANWARTDSHSRSEKMQWKRVE